jgi:small subunit ribosomal protein S1
MHQGTVINANDKGVLVSLPYGVEGFCPSRYMKKEDGTNAKVDDTLEFRILEFSKDTKKIILALPKMTEEKDAAKTSEEKAAEKAVKQTKRAVKQINDTIEHSTLGDLEVLAGLKENLEKQEKAQEEPKAE